MNQVIKSTTADRVIHIVAKVTGEPVEQIRLESKFFADIPMDSLDMMEIIMNIEEEFGITVPEDLEHVETVGEVVAYLDRELKQ